MIEQEFQDHDLGFEVYNGRSARFVTVTGRVWKGQGEIRVLTPEGREAIEQYRTSSPVTSHDAGPVPVDLPDIPELADYHVEEKALQALGKGLETLLADRSAALAQITLDLMCALHKRDSNLMSDDQVLAVLEANPYTMEVALDHRRQNYDKALKYLWDQHISKQRPKVGVVGADAFDVLPEVANDEKTEVKEPPPPLSYLDFTEDSPWDIPPRDWLIDRILLRNYITTLVARGGTAKSSLSLAMAVSLAAGEDFLQLGIEKRRKVLLINNEDDADELNRRLWAICIEHGIDRGQLRDWLYIHSGYENPLVIAYAHPELRDHVQGRIARLVTTAWAVDADIIVLDPYSSIHNVSENDNSQQAQVMGILRKVVAKANVGLLLIHHTKKGNQEAGDADLSRGASAVVDASRIVLTLTRATEDHVKELGVSEQEGKALVQLTTGKENFALSPTDGWWFRLESVDLGQGDHVGTVTRFDMQDILEARREEKDRQEIEAHSGDAMAIIEEMAEADAMNRTELIGRMEDLWEVGATQARKRINQCSPRAFGRQYAVEVEDEFEGGAVYLFWR